MNNNAFAYDPIAHQTMSRDSTTSYVSRPHNLFNMQEGGQRGLDGDPHTMSLVFDQQQPFSMPLYQYDPQLRNRQMFFPPQPHAAQTNNDAFYVNAPCPQAPVIADEYAASQGRTNGKYQPNPGSRQPADMEEISEEEKERQRVKREKNRIAAAKCRNRRREQLESLEKETEQLERENKNKRDILRLLQEEKENLTKALEDHEPKCTKTIAYEHKSNPQLV